MITFIVIIVYILIGIFVNYKYNANCITRCSSGFECLDLVRSGNKYDVIGKMEKRVVKEICYFKNGDFFKGEWKNGKKMGKEFFIIKIKIWKKKD